MSGQRTRPMTVGELSRRTGMSVKALREYTDLGLIHTLGRSPANYRMFDADALSCVRWIGELRGLGLTVAEIYELTTAGHEHGVADGSPGPRLAELLHRSRERLHQRITAQQQMLHRIGDFEAGHRTELTAGDACFTGDPRCASGGLTLTPGSDLTLPGIGPTHLWKESAVNTDNRQFATRFLDAVTSAPGVQLSLLRPLLTLLVSGEPVTIGQLAARAGRTEKEIRTALAAMPDTEYDTQGRIVGFGLTFNPTPHRYETHRRTLYTWCALDTLIFPAILGQSAKVTSPCRATGEPVRLTSTPDGPTDVEPATAVVSLVTPDTMDSVRSSFCSQSHFFTGTETAQDWLAEHPDAHVLPVADAYQAGRPLLEQVLSDTPSADCC